MYIQVAEEQLEEAQGETTCFPQVGRESMCAVAPRRLQWCEAVKGLFYVKARP